MNISPVNYNSYVSLRSNDTSKQQEKTTSTAQDLLNKVNDKFSPSTYGVFNAVLWTGLSYAIDRGFNKLFNWGTSKKMSLALSSAIGAFIGIQSYINAKAVNKQKNENVQES